MLKLNLGCGLSKLEGFINIDINPAVEPDVVADFTKSLPYEDDSVDWIVMFHVIEHIQEKKHPALLEEIWRVLKPFEGTLVLAYPEFSTIIKNWLDNKFGKREFWTATIYGRQSSPDDYHVTPIHTPDFKNLLEGIGFVDLDIRPQPTLDDFNTIVRARKGLKAESREDLLKREMITYGGVENALREI